MQQVISYFRESKYLVMVIVYTSLLLDNILLTVVVPIIPDYLYTSDLLLVARNGIVDPPSPDSENGRVAILLSSKALVQLIANPCVGYFVANFGCKPPLLSGSFCLLISATIAENYIWLFTARSLHGVASALIGVAGMCAIAERFPTEESRSRAMGAVLGSIALGVLLGYTLGGMLYDWLGKSAPFILLAVLAAIAAVLQCFVLDFTPTNPTSPQDDENDGMWSLLSDRHVLVTSGAIFISTSAMAILEPCLPLWLMQTVHPQKWQLGTVFIPDSVGYLIGTNFFGALAYQLGRGRVAFAAMLLVGIAAFIVPSVSTVAQLAVPHLCIGLGIGVVDAALVPLLARLVDSCNSDASYSSVYALQQAAVSLAYALGPLLGGAAVRAVGFPWLMRLVGVLNLLYCPLLAWLAIVSPPANKEPQLSILTGSTPVARYTTCQPHTCQPGAMKYHRFRDSDDSD